MLRLNCKQNLREIKWKARGWGEGKSKAVAHHSQNDTAG